MIRKFYLDKNKSYYLRVVSSRDLNDLHQICIKPEVSEFLTWEPHKNISETKDVIINFYMNKGRLPANFVIVDKANNKVIGVIDVMSDNTFTQDVVKIGYFLDSNYWNQGIMSLALKELLNIVFNILNYNKIGIRHLKDNTGSMKVINNNKFKFIKENENEKYYELQRSEYNENK